MLVPQLVACTTSTTDSDTSDTETQEQNTQPQINIPENFVLETMGGFWLDGTTLKMSVASETPILDLADRFSVPFGSKFMLTSDEAGEKELADTNIVLSEGDNVFYVKVSFRNDSFIYKAVVSYRHAYTVEFYSNCDASVSTQVINVGEKLSRPQDPNREGYIFQGWHLDGKLFDFNSAPTESCTLIAHWEKIDKTGGYYASDSLGYGAVEFNDISAGIHVVWKDYADSSGLRPNEVICILTQTYGNTVKTYEIMLCKDFAAWMDSSNAPEGAQLTQGEGGDWTLSLKKLPEKVGNETCTYTLKQQPISGNYTTQQASSAAINTLKGYVASVDDTAKLTTRNSRLYDAAGNMIVFTGVVSGNVGWNRLLTDTTPEGLKRLKATGCNAIRTTVPIIAIKSLGHAYVYWAENGNYRTGDYNDATSERVDETAKQKVIDTTSKMIDRATEAGLYIIINWPILTSNPYQYVEEACDFFGKISKKYADNPYVIYEICNEPANCNWSGSNGIKAYAERVIDTIRGNGSDGVIIVAPRASANYISMNPALYNTADDKINGYAGDDPIYDPLDDDRRYNVAYTHHCYPFENDYSGTNARQTIGWRLRDAYEAGLTMIITEMSPMAAKLDEADNIGYDFAQMDKYMRMFQEYDISYFYFKYLSTENYDEWMMFLPKVDPGKQAWTRDSLTECGKWYYDLVTGDGVFVTGIDYDAKSVRSLRDKYKTTFSAYGLEAKTGKSFFTVFPTFATSEASLGNGRYFFGVDDSDSLSDIAYQAYCQRIWKRIFAICGGTANQTSGAVFTDANIPSEKSMPMQLTYKYNGKTCTVNISYGQHNGSYGVFVEIK